MNKKGFTLIELLAVIVILGIIMLIAVPAVSYLIEKSKKDAVANSLLGIVDSATLYYANQVEAGTVTSAVINVKDGTLKYTGKVDKGSVLFNTEGKVKAIISYGKYCAYKNYDSDVVVGETISDNCNVSGSLIGLSTLEINSSELSVLISAITSSPPTGTGIENEIRVVTTTTIPNTTSYYVSNVAPSSYETGTVWVQIDLNSSISISMNNTYLPIKGLKQYDGSKWVTKEAYIYKSSSWLKFSDSVYTETVLNGTDPVLGTGMIPVTIADDGTVTYADTSSEWYNYTNKKWANAVILSSGTYTVGQTIPESAIRSYFVWIPKYSYQLWDVGTTSPTNIQFSINIKFGTTNTSDSSGECATVTTSGSNGNCDNLEYMTHPAFTTLGKNGIWVGKYETGYLGATTTATAEVASTDSSKIIVKPSVYSWRNNTVYNFFLASYNYNSTLGSHMIKNTEWGAITYLSHSIYGINREVRVNNNSSYLTGYSATTATNQSLMPGAAGTTATITLPYNTVTGYTSSSTGNITGIYDMSGGNNEYTASYVTGKVGSSGFTTGTLALYDAKYYDVYSASSAATTFTYRILGDATGELGTFNSFAESNGTSYYHSSWYGDYAVFIDATTNVWFFRGGLITNGSLAGQFCFGSYSGAAGTNLGTRLVLGI